MCGVLVGRRDPSGAVSPARPLRLATGVTGGGGAPDSTGGGLPRWDGQRGAAGAKRRTRRAGGARPTPPGVEPLGWQPIGPPLLRRELADAGVMSGRRFHVRGEHVKVTEPHFFLILRTVALDRGSLSRAAAALSLSSRREASDARSLLSEPRARESDRGALKSETRGGAGASGRSTTAVTVPTMRKQRGQRSSALYAGFSCSSAARPPPRQ